jgi:O-antigen/teichoic acid export membrane protein
MKLFLSAFEYAWAPFYFETMKEPDAKRTFSLVTTYGIMALVLLAAGLSSVSADLVRLMTKPAFYEAARVVPWIGLGVLFQGVYLLTSIGLNITKQTRYYPVATAAAAGTSVVLNVLLIPQYGALGAAWSNTLAYAVLASVGFLLSRRFYPVDYEWGRLGRVVLAGVSGYVASMVVVPSGVAVAVSLLLHGAVVVLTYLLVLVATSFYRREELAVVSRVVQRFRRRSPPAVVEQSAEMAGDVMAAVPDETAEFPVPDVDETDIEAPEPAAPTRPATRDGGTRDGGGSSRV